ncbi:hypothetical protein KP509_21G026100 [Ceratopteris richardii]|uniref:Replication factor A protein 3 n=1 Tax=Ceratopteris richardii TaxID=49495 RepID=A0A8T2SAB2_CERRI|nr:hypothetical protein KP509_21G026100 [Ceratopteris richardii]
MDTSNPAPLVNAELLKRYPGRRVRCVLKLVRAEGNSAFSGLTSDGMHVSVKQVPSATSLSQYVEVIGVVDSDRSIRAEMCTNFGDNFDMSSFNQLVQMANSEHQSLFI